MESNRPSPGFKRGIGGKRPASLLVILLLVLSAIAGLFFLVAPATAAVGLTQSNSASVSSPGGTTLLNIPFNYTVQSGNMIVVCLSWSSSVSSVSVTDTIGNPYTLIRTATNTAQASIYLTTQPVFASVADQVQTSWTNSVNVTANIFEINNVRFSKDSTNGTGPGPSVSTALATETEYNFALGCIATAKQRTITPGTKFDLAGTGPAGGAQFSMILNGPPSTSTTNFPASLSVAVNWAEVGINFFSFAGSSNSGIPVFFVNGGTSGVTQSLTRNTGPITVGNLLIVEAAVGADGVAMTISGGGLTYVRDSYSSDPTSGSQVAIYHALIPAAMKVTVTFSIGGGINKPMYLREFEVSSASNLVISARSAIGTSSTPVTSSLGGPPGSFELALMYHDGGVTTTPGAGFTSLGMDIQGTSSEYAQTGTTTTFPFSLTGSADWNEASVLYVPLVYNQLSALPGYSTTPVSTSNRFTVSFNTLGTPSSTYITGPNTVFFADPSSVVSISAVSSASTSTHQWVFKMSGGVAASYNYGTGAGVFVGLNLVYFEQFKNTLEATPLTPSTWDASRTVQIDGAQVGTVTAVVTFTPPNGGGVQSAAVWTDRGQYVVWQSSTGGAAGTSWVPSPIQSSAISSAGGTYNSNYVLMTTGMSSTTTTTTTRVSTVTSTLSSGPTVTVTTTSTKTSTTGGGGTATTTATVTITPETSFTTITQTQTFTTGSVTITHTQTVGGTVTVVHTSPGGTTTEIQTETEFFNSTITNSTTVFQNFGNATETTTETQTETTTEPNPSTATTTESLTETSTATSTETSNTTVTSVTSEANTLAVFLSYLWLLAIALFVILLLLVYILQLRRG
ncbi:MAG: hypothetical protein HY296_01415 [Thaumarchaeota archaeon]|nr:hypothetical protein [Nitrososphaerota archaeon]